MLVRTFRKKGNQRGRSPRFTRCWNRRWDWSGKEQKRRIIKFVAEKIKRNRKFKFSICHAGKG